MTPMEQSSLFSCTMCGECCRGFGGTYVEEKEIRAIAEYLGKGIKEFLNRYCIRSADRFLLGQREDGYCVFYTDACSIHPVKPKMCRKWPYIEGVLKDVANWYAMASSCPGMKRDATEEEILRQVRYQLSIQRSGASME